MTEFGAIIPTSEHCCSACAMLVIIRRARVYFIIFTFYVNNSSLTHALLSACSSWASFERNLGARKGKSLTLTGHAPSNAAPVP